MNIDQFKELLEAESPVHVEKRGDDFFVYFESIYDYISSKEVFDEINQPNIHLFHARKVRIRR